MPGEGESGLSELLDGRPARGWMVYGMAIGKSDAMDGAAGLRAQHRRAWVWCGRDGIGLTRKAIGGSCSAEWWRAVLL